MSVFIETEEKTTPIVYIVDDDQSVRDSLEDLLSSVGLRAISFPSAQHFMAGAQPDVTSCLVLDVRMPGLSGLDFQDELARSGIEIPIIFITAHGDIPMSVRAMKAGAVEFLTKPFRDQDLLDAIQQSLARDLERRQGAEVRAELCRRYATLNEGEKEVMELVVAGLLNKQIAAQLSLSEVTVKVRRGQVMRKMVAQSLADLVRYSERIHGTQQQILDLKRG
ncbi:response regulator transcription factor [Brevundimonas diminuta]|uniref:response regulator transcription factor n=1 Tax=Brevundimonas diminuta TaxID=293 RepID=UPI0022AEBA7F|nr:response regulator transcription factor [Brevundimonas diminuta]MCZ4107034.1 response regulator transcription factor [Brevundimonas diminuta]